MIDCTSTQKKPLLDMLIATESLFVLSPNDASNFQFNNFYPRHAPLLLLLCLKQYEKCDLRCFQEALGSKFRNFESNLICFLMPIALFTFALMMKSFQKVSDDGLANLTVMKYSYTNILLSLLSACVALRPLSIPSKQKKIVVLFYLHTLHLSEILWISVEHVLESIGHSLTRRTGP